MPHAFKEIPLMQYTSDTAHPFDTDNRAYRRFLAVASDHFDVIGWTTENGRPVMTTLRDLASGDLFTVAILDSLEMRDPYALLAFTTAGDLAAYGPFAGETVAADHAAALAMHTPDIAATRPMPLHHPDRPDLTNQAWKPVPPKYARAARAALVDAPTIALVLLDRARNILATVGPFPNHADAEAWSPTPGLDPTVERLVVALHPIVPAPQGL
jgi:hypothetical protein